jgi:hypothetical protein
MPAYGSTYLVGIYATPRVPYNNDSRAYLYRVRVDVPGVGGP